MASGLHPELETYTLETTLATGPRISSEKLGDRCPLLTQQVAPLQQDVSVSRDDALQSNLHQPATRESL